ncbi:MAG TPA: hypothetical protein VIH35_09020 [Kiritimatiellia bacterium]
MAVLLLGSALVRAAELPSPGIAEGWSACFAGKEFVLHVEPGAAVSAGDRLAWSIESGGRILIRREEALEEGTAVECRFSAPDVKEGVVLPVNFHAQVLGSDGQPRSAELVRRLNVFPEDAFHDRAAWLKERRIVLFDPVGDTAALFKEAGIPFEPARSPDAIDASSGGIVVIGEGASFASSKGLAGQMVSWAGAGLGVLCLAPSEGGFALPGANAEEPAPDRMAWRRSDIIKELDKTLDSGAWPPDGVVNSRSLLITTDRQGVRVSVQSDAAAWAWMEAGYGPGRVIVCMPEIVAKWSASPVPRYLLLAILQHLEGKDHEDVP